MREPLKKKSFITRVCIPNMKYLFLMVQMLWPMLKFFFLLLSFFLGGGGGGGRREFASEKQTENRTDFIAPGLHSACSEEGYAGYFIYVINLIVFVRSKDFSNTFVFLGSTIYMVTNQIIF